LTGKVISIAERSVENEGYELIAKFVTNADYKLTLLCYAKQGTNSQLAYFSVITDTNGKHLVSIENHDCLWAPIRVALYQVDGSDVIFLRVDDWFATCPLCSPPFWFKVKNYNLNVNYGVVRRITWKQVSLL
jgi:hypothetical protein